MEKLGGTGGLVALDKDGDTVVFNTAGMYQASIDKDGKREVMIYK